ncbi:MAG: hypothetical protein AB4368_29965 [Xenococcaceae cyanobacterium]
MLTRIYRENQSLEEEGISPNDLSQIPKSYSKGELDGQSNLNPSHPEDWDYWSGYSQGHREYWCRRKGISLPDEF